MAINITHHYYYEVPTDLQLLDAQKLFLELGRRVEISSENRQNFRLSILGNLDKRNVGDGLRIQVLSGSFLQARILFGVLMFNIDNQKPFLLPVYDYPNFAHISYFCIDVTDSKLMEGFDSTIKDRIPELITPEAKEVGLQAARKAIEENQDYLFIPDLVMDTPVAIESRPEPMERDLTSLFGHVFARTFEDQSRRWTVQVPVTSLPTPITPEPTTSSPT